MIHDLTVDKPRSPKVRLHNIAGLARFFDKVRARAGGALGEYKVGETSELDRQLKTFLNFDFDIIFSRAKVDSTDEELWEIISDGNILPDETECNVWSDQMESMKLIDDPERTKYAGHVIEVMKLPADITTFDFIDLGDK